ncbi:nuclear transport factor 2 family protein [Nonomuraea rubra]|uniref:Ketosteroid isomerase-like protein n=1 Tax=Nonomuraea rubra TaxID=46180 RepID=A0A7X0P5T4_9ACTN|nr:nuclear transport factor 2 family protein [Nonomuraea rubra]MBB6555792.1 ketosteroid isomerase-like protein [Nonomuraea rubra]
MSIDEIVTGFHAAMRHKSADELAGLYAEDGLHEFPFGEMAPLEGREAVRESYRAMWGATPFEADEVRRVSLHRTEDPEVVVVEQTVHGTAGGRELTVPGLLVLRIRDGRIVHARDYMDFSAIARIRAAG